MRKLLFSVILVLVLFTSPHVFADTLVDVGGTTGSWQAWVAPDANIPPYWDGYTSDPVPPGPINIGYYMKNYQGAGPGWQFWANNAAGKADPDFLLNKTNPGQNATFKLEVAGFASANELWWYDSSSSYKEKIFPGSDGPGTSKNFTPTTHWGFAIHTQENNWFYTESSSLGNDRGFQHFAVFQNPNAPETYWIGVEDLLYLSGDNTTTPFS